ncbi:MAG: hypothetical protein IPH04_01345 [Saprospirales bacterium]|nr:hypothetical protein [Saprospirales bacterium]
MILPPRDPCPTISVCTFEWYELVGANEIFLNNQTQFLLATHPGIYIFESDCNGCLRRDTFYLAGCNNPCSCGTLAWADFAQGWNVISAIDSLTLVQAPCPNAGQNYFIHGDFSCAQLSCGSNQVDWVLTRPSPLPSLSGSTFSSPYPHFDIYLPWSDCVAPGIYTLTITRYCGLVPCSYKFRFQVPNCGCLCSDLPADAGMGFGTNSGINCIRYFKPYGLDACDVVSWTIDGTLAPGSSIGNNGFGYNFGPLGSGTYTVCMQVTRTPLVGPPCTFKKCQTVIVNCGGPITGLCLRATRPKRQLYRGSGQRASRRRRRRRG